MKRLVLGLGVAVIVAAAILGYLLYGGEETPPVTAENATEQQVVDRAAAVEEGSSASPQASPTQDPERPDQPAADLSIGSSAAEDESSAPVEQVARPQVVSRRDPAAAVSQDSPATTDGPTFDVVRVEPSGAAVIAGRAAPESEVTVTLGEGGTVGTAKADRSGAWAIVAEQPLAPGSHQIGIEAKTPQGEKQLSDNLVVVLVPESKAPPAANGADKPAERRDSSAIPGEEAPVLAVLTPRVGGASKVLPQGPAEGIAAGSLVLDSVDYDASGRAILGGRAQPGARMLVYLDNRPIGEAVAGEDGRWTLSPASPILEGLHDLRVDEVDTNGTVVARVETPFSRQRAKPLAAGDDYVIVQPGNSLWRIARRTYGAGLRYTVIYQANASQIRDPDLIYPGQVFALPRRN